MKPPSHAAAPGGRSGHIGLTVLGSIVAGLALGLVLVLGLLAGSEEATRRTRRASAPSIGPAKPGVVEAP